MRRVDDDGLYTLVGSRHDPSLSPVLRLDNAGFRGANSMKKISSTVSKIEYYCPSIVETKNPPPKKPHHQVRSEPTLTPQRTHMILSS